jgi:hypothetical protein
MIQFYIAPLLTCFGETLVQKVGYSMYQVYPLRRLAEHAIITLIFTQHLAMRLAYQSWGANEIEPGVWLHSCYPEYIP